MPLFKNANDVASTGRRARLGPSASPGAVSAFHPVKAATWGPGGTHANRAAHALARGLAAAWGASHYTQLALARQLTQTGYGGQITPHIEFQRA